MKLEPNSTKRSREIPVFVYVPDGRWITGHVTPGHIAEPFIDLYLDEAIVSDRPGASVVDANGRIIGMLADYNYRFIDSKYFYYAGCPQNTLPRWAFYRGIQIISLSGVDPAFDPPAEAPLLN